MKKIIKWVLSIGAIVALIICGIMLNKPTEPESVSVTLTGIDVNETIEQDYTAINDSDVLFYESQITLSNVLDSNYVADVKSVTNVFQLRDTSYQFIHEIVDGVQTDSVIKINDYWLEDQKINFKQVIPFGIALDAVANSQLYPDVHIITLRAPLGPNVTNPFYIFGRVTSVDACTEEVMTCEEMFERIFHIEPKNPTDSISNDSIVN